MGFGNLRWIGPRSSLSTKHAMTQLKQQETMSEHQPALALVAAASLPGLLWGMLQALAATAPHDMRPRSFPARVYLRDLREKKTLRQIRIEAALALDDYLTKICAFTVSALNALRMPSTLFRLL
jgi:hypothetical protein